MKHSQSSRMVPFSKELHRMSRPILLELSRSTAAELITRSCESYVEFLEASHRAMMEAQRLIDWKILQERGLPEINARQDRFLDLASDLAELGCPPKYHVVPEESAIFPTFGISLGGLFAWEAGARSGRRTARAVVGALPFLQGNQMSFLKGHGCESAKLWRSFQRWVDGSVKTDEERDEARFAVEASFRFVQRHFESCEITKAPEILLDNESLPC